MITGDDVDAIGRAAPAIPTVTTDPAFEEYVAAQLSARCEWRNLLQPIQAAAQPDCDAPPARVLRIAPCCHHPAVHLLCHPHALYVMTVLRAVREAQYPGGWICEQCGHCCYHPDATATRYGPEGHDHPRPT